MIRFAILFCSCLAFSVSQQPPPASNELRFTISKSWKGVDLNEADWIHITLIGDPNSLDVRVNVRAPFYGEPAPNARTEDIFGYLWKSEVVEVYFSNDKDQYNQIQLGPYGHYESLFFNGERGEIAYGLPIEYEATISGSTWFGTAVIQGDFFPSNVTKFNAAAMHGYVNLTEGRFSMLYPDKPTSTQPNFHDLSLFQPIAMSTLNPQFEDSPVSPLWQSLLRGEFEFVIKKTWDLKDLPIKDQVKVVLQKVPSRDGVLLKIEAPFYNDPAPPAEPGANFFGIWDYEVVEVYFLNRDDQYLQIQISPQGQYHVYLFNGKRTLLRNKLPLNVTSNIVGSTWTAEVFIPQGYFPPAAQKISAAAQHGPLGNRQYYTLTPSPVVLDNPDFHNLPYFKAFSMTNLIRNGGEHRSSLWNTALQEEFQYVIQYTWDGKPIPEEEHININLEAVEGSLDMSLKIEAPFYDDTPPNAAPGESFNDLRNFEAVEFYILNAADQYLQIQVAPRGQYFVLFYAGERNMIRHTLPLNVSTSIQGSRWAANVVIPGEYLPEKITRINAAGSHGPESNRKYNLLCPTLGPFRTVPNYHNLATYKRVAIERLNPIYKMAPMSSTWRAALKGESLFVIRNTLEGESLPKSEEIAISLRRKENSSDIYVRIEAPFYNDTAPDAAPGSFQAIWTYEVVDLYFLNKDDLYLQIQISPHGHYWVLFLNGTRNVIKNGLPLNSTSTISEDAWTAEATIPGDYFPPEVRLFNAAAMHGEGNLRKYVSLYSLPTGITQTKPDFHDLRLFRPFDIREHVHGPESDNSAISALWEEALRREQTQLKSV